MSSPRRRRISTRSSAWAAWASQRERLIGWRGGRPALAAACLPEPLRQVQVAVQTGARLRLHHLRHRLRRSSAGAGSRLFDRQLDQLPAPPDLLARRNASESEVGH
jgi:hypothetical protein